MRGDFSLLRPDLSDYSLVLMQQGRVLVESDWNAAMTTLISTQRTLAADLIGPHGGPAPIPGFRPSRINNDDADLALGAGVYYVDGIRCELPADLDKLHWSQQPYPIALKPPELPTGVAYLVYLDVWERHVSALEDDTIREVALGGPDSTSRRQIIWQVRVMPYPPEGVDNPTCDTFALALDDWRTSLRGNPPLLRARTEPPPKDDDPCLASPDARYRGKENQLYRVEIVSVATGGGDGTPATFVWSRENGSVAAAWTATDTVDNRLHVAGIRDTRRGFAPNNWVELTWDTLEFAGLAGTRVQLTDVDGPVLTIDPDTASGDIAPEPSIHPHAKVRRWDQPDSKAKPLVKGAVGVVESNADDNGWIPLEDGIEIQFQAAGGQHDYRVGDYWTIPARVATGDIIWPREDGAPVAVQPHGIEHHYAPLAWISGAADPLTLQKAFQQAACLKTTQQRRGNR